MRTLSYVGTGQGALSAPLTRQRSLVQVQVCPPEKVRGEHDRGRWFKSSIIHRDWCGVRNHLESKVVRVHREGRETLLLRWRSEAYSVGQRAIFLSSEILLPYLY